MAILRRTERAMVRSMCGVKLTDKRKTDDLMEMLGLEESVERLAKANGVRWYGHVLRKDEFHPLRKALDFKVDGRKGRGRPKKRKNQLGGGGAEEGWTKEGRCSKQIEMAGWCEGDCCKS